MNTDESVTRYVITHLDKNGQRTLIDAAQGRYTYATMDEAQRLLDAIMTVNSIQRIQSLFGLPLEVRACPCWPNHFDPKRVYFE
jgi:hypothetical protein